jgi:thiamine-phosphate diphosphorylase
VADRPSLRLAREAVAGLYAIVDGEHSADEVGDTEAFLAAGCGVLQLRIKEAAPQALRSTARAVAARCDAAGALLLVNDHLEIAAELPKAGLHLGQGDLHPRLARQRLGPGRVIGVSTHDPEELAEALRWEVDYVGFGPVYDTGTKGHPMVGQGLGALRRAVDASRVPVVAIGGVRLGSVGEVASTGVAAAAVIADLYRGPDRRARARAFIEAFRAGCPRS